MNTNLTFFNASGNDIGDAGAIAIAGQELEDVLLELAESMQLIVFCLRAFLIML